MSRRPRKTEHGISDFEALMKAIKQVKVDKKSKQSTAREYNIPRSSLVRYIAKLDATIPDITQVSDVELMKAIKAVASYCTPSLVCGFFKKIFRVYGIIVIFHIQFQCFSLYFRFSMKRKKKHLWAIFCDAATTITASVLLSCAN